LLVLFAAFFSAVLLALTSFARSFKEAQAYLVPLMLVSLVPGVLGMMPGLRLQGVLTVTPLVNIVLLARDLAERTATPARAAVVVLSTLVYAAAAITVAARIFGAEAVLFSEQSGWSDLFRRPAKSRPAATLSGGLLCLALLLPLSFALASLMPQALEWRLTYQVLGTFLMFGGVPLAACFMARINVQSSFQMAAPSWTAWLAALLLAFAAVPAIYQLLLLLRQWDLLFLTSQMEQHLRALTRGWRETSSATTVAATFALIGVGEELFFRGFLFSALRTHVSQRWTIIGSALLFGFFHFVSQADQLIPSTLMGMLLGWVCWQTRSVLPGMLLHASYNALFVLLTYYERGLDDPDTLQEILNWWQIAAVAAALIGAGLIWRFRSPARPAASVVPPADKILGRNVPAERTA
jgi:sodium transport system permease protein